MQFKCCFIKPVGKQSNLWAKFLSSTATFLHFYTFTGDKDKKFSAMPHTRNDSQLLFENTVLFSNYFPINYYSIAKAWGREHTCVWCVFTCLPWEILYWVWSGQAIILLLGSQEASGSGLRVGIWVQQLSQTELWFWLRGLWVSTGFLWLLQGARVQYASFTKHHGSAEKYWLFVLFPALLACWCLSRGLLASDPGKRPFLIYDIWEITNWGFSDWESATTPLMLLICNFVEHVTRYEIGASSQNIHPQSWITQGLKDFGYKTLPVCLSQGVNKG